MNNQEEKKKPIPTRLYVSCPVCATLLMQSARTENTKIKCPKCRNMITVEVERNKVITLAPIGDVVDDC